MLVAEKGSGAEPTAVVRDRHLEPAGADMEAKLERRRLGVLEDVRHRLAHKQAEMVSRRRG